MGNDRSKASGSSIQVKLLLPLAVLGVVIAALVGVMIERTAVREVEKNSVSSAEAIARRESTLRAYYTKNVVHRATAHGLRFEHDYAEHDGVLPLPATMIHELNDSATDGPRIRLFSDAPFPWRRETGGPRDDFERQAWAALNAHPDHPFSRVDSVGGERTVRYAVADRMVDQTCLDCHNTHPQSPRTNWKLGDVRGALEVSIPIGGSLVAARSQARQASLLVLLVLGLGLGAVAWITRRSVVGPLRRIAGAADRIAGGDFTLRVPDASGDELGVLGAAFNRMASDLETRDGALQRHRADLEQTVASRTRELSSRNAAMQRVLENVNQGFLSIDRDGRMSAERSAILVRWLGMAEANEHIWSYLGRADETAATSLELGWGQLCDGLLPRDLLLGQLPQRLHAGELTLALDYRPILEGGQLAKLLVIVSDLTPRLARERGEAKQRELMAVFEHLMKDKAGFLDFLRDADAIVSFVSGSKGDYATVRRQIHTLKGNAAIFGAKGVSDQCHAVESEIEVTGSHPTEASKSALRAEWNDFRDSISSLLVGCEDRMIEIEDEDYQAVLRSVLTQEPYEEVARRIRAWRLEPTQRPLQHLAEQAVLLGRRLGKGEIDVLVEDNGMRIDRQKWRPFWSSLTHVVRNAVDHGFETEDERAAAGKNAPRLVLRTRQDCGRFVVEIRDDGNGVDWERVRVKARERGLPSTTQADLVAALFVDGVSTKEEITEVSGRGVGLAAARAACRDLGGSTRVESSPGAGTTMRFEFGLGAGVSLRPSAPPPRAEDALA